MQILFLIKTIITQHDRKISLLKAKIARPDFGAGDIPVLLTAG